ncbi:MAG: alpha/beta hydrolase [Clostridiales bacterium]|nr:alpha/beta hydrolase [Clostridiales bacterium]
MLKDYLRESFSYFGIYKELKTLTKVTTPERVDYGEDKDQYFLFYEPKELKSEKVIIWIHGGGWNAGDPEYFDYVGQCFAKHGYRAASIGYRLSPGNKYPAQIEDVCTCFNRVLQYMRDKGIDTDHLVVAGPSAGAHLSSILCYSKEDQERYGVDLSGVIGYIGSGGPYSFRKDQGNTLKILLNMLFEKGYDRKQAEPVSLMSKSDIPALLIQSEHDGLLEFACAEDFKKKADSLGIRCEIYKVVDKENTHSWYTAGMFMRNRQQNQCLDKFFSFIEDL